MAIVDAGIDYLRLTARPGEGMKSVYDVWEREMCAAEDQGHKRKVWKWQGYEGEEIAGLYRGMREDGMIAEARGGVSSHTFWNMKDVPFDGNVPRIDFKVDVNGETETAVETEALYNALTIEGVQSAAQRRRNLVFHRQRDRADTLYVGSRNSGAHVCIYDARARHPELYSQPTRRYECRYTNEAARDRYAIAANAASMTCVSTSIVVGQLMAAGLQREWFADSPPIAPMKHYVKTDDERSFAWIENHVAKTVRRLLGRGYGPQLAHVFGVEELVPLAKLPGNAVFKRARRSRAKEN